MPIHSEMHGVSRGGTETRSWAVFSIFNSANTYAKTPAYHVESPEACHWLDPLRILCTIRWRKITTAVTVAPKHTGDLKLLPPKLHTELKSPINRTILALELINAPPNNQRAA